jgi:hypothetical protein
VQIVHSTRRGSREIDHIGSAHDEQELEALKAVARQRLAHGQGKLDLGLDKAAAAVASAGPLRIVCSRMSHLWDALSGAYDALGFAEAAGGDDVFRQLVLARIVEPTSKQDSLRVLGEVGVDPMSYRTVMRRLPVYAKDSWRQRLAAAVQARFEGSAHLSPQARLDRSPPDHRVRRPCHHPADRGPHRLVDQEVHPNRPPLPHRPDPRRPPHPHRPRSTSGRATRRARALIN